MKKLHKVLIYDFCVSTAIMFSICLLDITTKLIFNNVIGEGKNIVAIKYLLTFNVVHNSGISYGWLANSTILILVFTLIAIGALGFFFTKVNLKEKKLYTTSMIFLLGGALGNAIDRVTLAYVIDFIHFPFLDYILGRYNFTCNLADIYLTAGIIILVIDLIMQEVKQAKLRKSQKKLNIIQKDESNK